jgi:hypothetical protein
LTSSITACCALAMSDPVGPPASVIGTIVPSWIGFGPAAARRRGASKASVPPQTAAPSRRRRDGEKIRFIPRSSQALPSPCRSRRGRANGALLRSIRRVVQPVLP